MAFNWLPSRTVSVSVLQNDRRSKNKYSEKYTIDTNILLVVLYRVVKYLMWSLCLSVHRLFVSFPEALDTFFVSFTLET
jgi:hypothetical protein